MAKVDKGDMSCDGDEHLLDDESPMPSYDKTKPPPVRLLSTRQREMFIHDGRLHHLHTFVAGRTKKAFHCAQRQLCKGRIHVNALDQTYSRTIVPPSFVNRYFPRDRQNARAENPVYLLYSI
jgi:hypothetical protein